MSSQKLQKHCEILKYHFGEFYEQYCENDVIEFSVNSDSTVWLERLGEPMMQIGTMESSKVMSIISTVADSIGDVATKETPIVEGEFPLDGARFEGVSPPIADHGMFSIRKKASKIIPLEEYVKQGILLPEHLPYLDNSIKKKWNILVAGGTGSGKTTFVNALIQRLSILCPEDRIGIIENTRELQCASKNHFFLRASAWISETTLVKAILRLRPDRIINGEVRGVEASDLLIAWNTGHPGGICTIHSDSASKTFTRLEELVGNKRNIIGDTIDLIIYLQKIKGERKVTEIVRCNGYDKKAEEYKLEQIYVYKA